MVYLTKKDERDMNNYETLSCAPVDLQVHLAVEKLRQLMNSEE